MDSRARKRAMLSHFELRTAASRPGSDGVAQLGELDRGTQFYFTENFGKARIVRERYRLRGQPAELFDPRARQHARQQGVAQLVERVEQLVPMRDGTAAPADFVGN